MLLSIQSLTYYREIIQSLWIHAFLLVSIFLFTLISPHLSLKQEKYITVNLKNLSMPGGGPAGGTKNAGADKNAPLPLPPAKKEPQVKVLGQKEVPQVVPQPKEQKPIAKTLAPQKAVPVTAKPEPPTPSLKDRLKNRLENVKKTTPATVSPKFVEADKFVASESKANAANKTNQKFVEAADWSRAQTIRGGGASTQMAVGSGSGSGNGYGSGNGNGYGDDFPYAWYLNLIQTKITNNWKEPPKPMVNDGNLYAVVSFVIDRGGDISKITIVEKASLAALNDSIEEAVKISNPLPPLPNDYPDDTLTVRIKFELTQ